MAEFHLTRQERESLLDALDRGEDFRWVWYVDQCVIPSVERILERRLRVTSQPGAVVPGNEASVEDGSQ